MSHTAGELLLPESPEPPMPLLLLEPPELVVLVPVPVPVLASPLSAGTVVGGAELKPVAVSGPPHAATRLAAAHRRASDGARNIARAYRRSSGATTLRLGLGLEERLDLVQRQPLGALRRD